MIPLILEYILGLNENFKRFYTWMIILQIGYGYKLCLFLLVGIFQKPQMLKGTFLGI